MEIAGTLVFGGNMIKKNCEQCGVEFSGKKIGAKYCSDKCRKKAYVVNNKEKRSETQKAYKNSKEDINKK